MHMQNNEDCYVNKWHQGGGEKTKYDHDVGNNKHKRVANWFAKYGHNVGNVTTKMVNVF